MNLFFRKTPASIAGHEQKLVELGRQIADAEADLAHAEAASVDAALDGTGLSKATEEVVRTVAALGALRSAKSQVESELAALRERAAEDALTAKIETAQDRVGEWKERANELREQIAPLLAEADAVIGQVNQNYGFLAGVVATEALFAPLAALAFTGDNTDAILSFLARRNSDAADRVLAVP